MLALLLASISACGLRLQGGERWPAQWPGYKLDFPSRDAAMQDFVDVLDESLRRQGLAPERQPAVGLILRSVQDEKSVAAIGTDGRAVEFDLRRELVFQIRAGEWQSPVYSLQASRRLSFDPAVVLAKEAEEERLLQSLSRDLTELLILRVDSALRDREPG